MTRKQYEREKLRLAREKQLRILIEAERNADPRYVISAAGLALERWQGKRSPALGKHRLPCPTTSPSVMNSTSSSVASSDFSLST